MLSLDQICEVLQTPGLYIKMKKHGIVPCSTVTRRKISSVLSFSDLFIRTGSPRVAMWGIALHNPQFLSNSVISASVEEMLIQNGPSTLEYFVDQTQLNGADIQLFQTFLTEHEFEFAKGEDGRYWFANQPRPVLMDFKSICKGLIHALETVFVSGASIEELHWYLCLATVNNAKCFTRRCISRELNRRGRLFTRLSRARYTLVKDQDGEAPEELVEDNQEELDFDAFSFFDDDFHFV